MARRILFLVVLMLWLGGSLFYAAVVIPVGLSTLQPPHQQTFVTRRVTVYQNGLAGLVLVLTAWDVLATSDPSARRKRARWLASFLMAGCLAGLLWLHPKLDALMDPARMSPRNREALRPLHLAYVAVGSVQMAAAMGLVVLTVFAWREEDRWG